MKKDQVKVGNVYSAKITDKVVPVRIDAENRNGGWDGTNLQTNRKVRIKSAQKLRGQIKVPDAVKDEKANPAAKAKTKAESAKAEPKRAKKKLTAKERKALQAQHKADQENARVRDERAKSGDGMTASERAMAESEPKKKSGKKAAKPKAEKKDKRLSCIDAAAQVLADSGEPMRCRDMIDTMAEKGLWTSDAPTPHATLYSAILREIQTKGDESRFQKVERGLFTLAKGA